MLRALLAVVGEALRNSFLTQQLLVKVREISFDIFLRESKRSDFFWDFEFYENLL